MFYGLLGFVLGYAAATYIAGHYGAKLAALEASLKAEILKALGK
jgi:hypothetical protein